MRVKGLARAGVVGVLLSSGVATAALLWMTEETNSVNALVPGGPGYSTYQVTVPHSSAVFDITMGSFVNYSTEPLTVLAVRPDVDSKGEETLGAFLVRSCVPDTRLSAIFEPHNRWSTSWYFPRSQTSSTMPVLVPPRVALTNRRPSNRESLSKRATACAMEPAWVWELRVAFLRPGRYQIPGFTVTYRQDGATHVVQDRELRFLFDFTGGHGRGSARSGTS